MGRLQCRRTSDPRPSERDGYAGETTARTRVVQGCEAWVYAFFESLTFFDFPSYVVNRLNCYADATKPPNPASQSSKPGKLSPNQMLVCIQPNGFLLLRENNPKR